MSKSKGLPRQSVNVDGMRSKADDRAMIGATPQNRYERRAVARARRKKT